MSRRAIAALLVVALACGDDDGGALDSGPPDAGLDAGPARLALVGPEVGFVGEPTCVRTEPLREATFFWGDGERTEGGPEACHAYGYPGAFVVSAVTPTEDASYTLRVVERPDALRPTASSPIAFDGGRLWVVTPDADSIAFFDDEGTDAVEHATCARPRTLAIGAEHVAVACQDGAALALHDRSSGARVTEVALPTGSRPFAVVVDPRDGKRFIVSLQDLGAVAVVRDGALERVVEVGPDARALSMNEDGLLLVSRWRATSEGSSIYVLDLADPAAPSAWPPALLPPQTGLDSDTDNSGVLGFLDTVAFTPEGRRALVPALKANIVTGIFRTGGPMDSQTTARAVMAEVFAEDGVAEETFRFSFDDLDYASAMVATELGDRVLVAMHGAQQVIAVDAASFDIVGSIANVGIGPRGLALDGDRLFVWAELERDVRVNDVSDPSREPPVLATISTVTTEPLDPEVLRGKQLFASAVDPRMSRTSYLSCASCHLDGEGDNLVWDFTQRGEGLRNTIPLQGSAQHLPLHWSGNFDEVQDFEGDIRLHQGGTGFLADADWSERGDPLGGPKAGLSEELDALAAYVLSLRSVGSSPFRRDDDAFRRERARGATLFADAGCATCHAGDALADGMRHDVGTLGPGSGSRLFEPLDGIDTPTLVGLWRTAPYLHDGSAPTLRDVLTTRNGDDAHGATSTLTEDELDALELYLLTLDDVSAR